MGRDHAAISQAGLMCLGSLHMFPRYVWVVAVTLYQMVQPIIAN